MIIAFHAKFEADLNRLLKEDRKLGAKVWDLILDIERYRDSPLNGKGKPERLRGNLSDFYSRRITDKHRLIYTFTNGELNVVSCYGHYDDR